jgi:hypothetical protein
MTDQRMDEYRAYYRARLRRYDGNPLYPNMAQAERELCACVEASSSVEDMQRRVLAGGHCVDCGRALLRDQANARVALYSETADAVRAQAPAEVLASVDSVTDAAGLASLASSAQARTDAAVTADELTRLWTQSIASLENIEVWQSAVVPDRWRDQLDEFVADTTRAEREAWAQVQARAAHHLPGWRFDESAAREQRHRRLVPLPDAVIGRRLAQHRAVTRSES